MQDMNMSKICRMQRSYRWQPHLPFMPIYLASHPWAKRYDYKYDTLPIVEVSVGLWTLDKTVLSQWDRHVTFFSQLLLKWRNYLAMAPMSVDYLPSIHDRDIRRTFSTQKQARGYYWYYRTLIFSMFAEFSFIVAGRSNWIQQLEELFERMNMDLPRDWLTGTQSALCDFQYTKRAGVVVPVTTPELLPFVERYHNNGVPTLVSVGEITFHDRDDNPQPPSIHIHPFPNFYRKDWPSRVTILSQTRSHLQEYYWQRLTPFTPSVIRPLSVSRPPVEEVGGVLHDRPMTSSWVNPETNEPVGFIQVAEPMPSAQAPRPPSNSIGWVEFFHNRGESNKGRLEKETATETQRRESRIRDSIKINQIHSSGPSKKSTVFQWVLEEPATREEDRLPTMKEDSPPVWRRVRVNRAEVEDVWDEYLPSQRVYDPFRNEWDLMRLFDVEGEAPDHDYDDDDDFPMGDATAPYDPPIAYLDEVQETPNVTYLSSEITLIAPKGLATWALHTLGLACTQLARPFVECKGLQNVIGYSISRPDLTTGPYRHLQEFVSYFLAGKLDHPALRELSDLHPSHHRPLQVDNGDLQILRVPMIHSTLVHGNNGVYKMTPVQRVAYILKPKNDVSGFKPTWELAIFNATTVVQIIRNRWGSASMEELVRRLVRHGIEFNTLIPASKVIPDEIVKLNEAPDSFTTLPRMAKPKHDASDYAAYDKLRRTILSSPHAKPAFRSGGVIWRLAMENEGDIYAIVDSILDGPIDMGPTRGEYFQAGDKKYYDNTIPLVIQDTICGTYGVNGCKFIYSFNTA